MKRNFKSRCVALRKWFWRLSVNWSIHKRVSSCLNLSMKCLILVYKNWKVVCKLEKLVPLLLTVKKFFKVLAYSIYILRKFKNFLKGLALSSYTLKKILKTLLRCLLSLYAFWKNSKLFFYYVLKKSKDLLYTYSPFFLTLKQKRFYFGCAF